MLSPDFTAAASRLCTACGMCCNGVLFEIVRLQSGDSTRALESLGLKINRKKKEPYFHQPCSALKGCTCTVYEGRPVRCRLFECKLLKKLASDEITESEADLVITKTRHLVHLVEQFLSTHGDPEGAKPLIERYRQRMESLESECTQELSAQMKALHDFLNQHFRLEPESWNTLKPLDRTSK